LYFACTTIASSREPKETARKHPLTRQKKPNNLSVRACAYVCRYPTIEAPCLVRPCNVCNLGASRTVAPNAAA
jgi:hypothetical protein